MDKRRALFISVAYLVVVLIFNFMGVTGRAYFVGFLAVIILGFLLYPRGDNEGDSHGRDPNER